MPRPPRELRPHESVRAFFGAELRHWRIARGYSREELETPSAHQMAPMTRGEIGQLLENNSPVTLTEDAGVRTLASLCGGWPLLSSVVGASVMQDITAGATETVAVRRAVSALREDGPHALDVWDAGRREGTMGRVNLAIILRAYRRLAKINQDR